MIAEPPFEAGAVQLTVAAVFAETAETPVGAPGIVIGVTEVEAKEGSELPVEFVAFTVNVTAVPLVSPVKLAVKTFPTVNELPEDDVRVYAVIAEPPSEAGAVHDTVADALPATAETPVGTSGSAAVGVIVVEAEESKEGPTEFIATTVNVTGVSLVKLSLAVNTLPTVTWLPTDGVSLYPVIANPPFEAGAVQDTIAEALPATAETPVGAPGTVAGITAAEAEEFEEFPTEFIA